MQYADELKIGMIFKNGEHSRLFRTVDPKVKHCLSDPTIQGVMRVLMNEHKQTEGMLLVWGRGQIEFHNIIDVTKELKDECESQAT